jgi:hypothetical protein
MADCDMLTRTIDRLFQRLAATYGAAWDRSLGTAPIEDVKAIWQRELAGFTGKLSALAYALDHLPERCPNMIEFRNLCRAAPDAPAAQLPAPTVNPERIGQARALLAELNAKMRTGQIQDPKDWARRIIARHDAGEHVLPISLRFAREALGLVGGSQGSRSMGGTDWQAVADFGAQLDRSTQMRQSREEVTA